MGLQRRAAEDHTAAESSILQRHVEGVWRVEGVRREACAGGIGGR